MSTDEDIINGLIQGRGAEAARNYAVQTRDQYRRAVLNPKHFASTAHYRRSFIMSYLFYKHFLQTRIVPPGAGGASAAHGCRPSGQPHPPKFLEDCERRIDEELAASMPASDPPSWTLGGSVASQRRKPCSH